MFKDSSGLPVSHVLNSVNGGRWENHLVLYNNYMGNSTKTNQWGTESLLRPISDWIVNDTVIAVVEAIEIGYGDSQKDMTIPDGKFVLSGNASGDTFLRNYCQVGDTVKIYQGFANSPSRMTQYVGGGPWMLKNGVDVTAQNNEGVGADFYAARHPRTAVGFNADSTKVYFVVIDGRNPHSVGMTLPELASFMKSLGVAHATNLDGGGSTTFTVRSEVKNVLSDGWERIVANALMCVSSAPDSDLAIVQIERDSIAVYKNNTFDVPMSGWDMYYNPKPIPEGSGLEITFPNPLGSYSNGQFTASAFDFDGSIYTDLNGVKDSMRVHIISIDSLSSYPKNVVSDSLKDIQFFVYGKEDGGLKEKLDNSIFEFEILDENIGSIDEDGLFTPVCSGETKLVVHYGTDSDTADIKIECGSSELILDDIETLEGWTLSGENLDMTQSSVSLVDRTSGSEGQKALRVDYVTNGSGTIILETTPKTAFGVPEKYLIDAKSDMQRHRLYLVFEDANGNEYKFKASGFFSGDQWESKSISSTAIIPGDGGEYYPMRLKQIYIDLANGDISGSLYFDFIRTIYPGWTSIEDTNDPYLPSKFNLKQNYPNPFNPLTAITYQLSADSRVELNIYNVNGKKVTSIMNEMQSAGSYTLTFDASMLPGGVYFYRMQAGEWSDTKKMLLLK